MKPIFYLNGKVFPTPSRGLKVGRYQIVDSARNANGTVVSQKIGDRQIKFENFQWKYLDARTWHDILQEIEKFEVTVTFYDVYSMSWVSKVCYFGDASEEPYWFNENGEPTHFINCQCNIIDMGK